MAHHLTLVSLGDRVLMRQNLPWNKSWHLSVPPAMLIYLQPQRIRSHHFMMQQSPSATIEELRGWKKMMGTTNQYTGINYTCYNLNIHNNKAEGVSVLLRTIKWLHIHWRLY